MGVQYILILTEKNRISENLIQFVMRYTVKFSLTIYHSFKETEITRFPFC
jgi:hypothetical protein